MITCANFAAFTVESQFIHWTNPGGAGFAHLVVTISVAGNPLAISAEWAAI